MCCRAVRRGKVSELLFSGPDLPSRVAASGESLAHSSRDAGRTPALRFVLCMNTLQLVYTRYNVANMYTRIGRGGPPPPSILVAPTGRDVTKRRGR